MPSQLILCQKRLEQSKELRNTPFKHNANLLEDGIFDG